MAASLRIVSWVLLAAIIVVTLDTTCFKSSRSVRARVRHRPLEGRTRQQGFVLAHDPGRSEITSRSLNPIETKGAGPLDAFLLALPL